MSLDKLSPAPGSRKARKRKGRGPGSGNGKTAGKGHKGQKARSGGSTPLGFEGGQMPLYRRLPKRGFNNAKFRTVYVTVNVSDLERLDAGTEVTLESLLESKFVKKGKANAGLKVLGNGELTKKLSVTAEKFSASAIAKIEAAGGTVTVLGAAPEAADAADDGDDAPAEGN